MTQVTLKEEFDDLLLELRHQKDMPYKVIEHLRIYPAFLEKKIELILKQEKKERVAKLKKLQTKNEQLRRKVQDYSQTKGIIVDLKSDNNRKKEKIEELSSFILDQDKVVSKLKKEIKKKPKVIKDTSSMKQLNSQEEYIASQDIIIKDLREKVIRLNERNQELYKKSLTLHKLNKTKEEFGVHIATEIKSLKSMYDSHRDTSQNQIKALQQEKRILKDKLSKLEDRLRYTLIFNWKRFCDWFWDFKSPRE